LEKIIVKKEDSKTVEKKEKMTNEILKKLSNLKNDRIFRKTILDNYYEENKNNSLNSSLDNDNDDSNQNFTKISLQRKTQQS